MIRNTPIGGVQKLRSRSTLRVSLPLMMHITVHHGTKCATVRQHSELRSNERDISCAYVSNCLHICCAMCYLADIQLISLLQHVTISGDFSHYARIPCILDMWRGDVAIS